MAEPTPAISSENARAEIMDLWKRFATEDNRDDVHGKRRGCRGAAALLGSAPESPRPKVATAAIEEAKEESGFARNKKLPKGAGRIT